MAEAARDENKFLLRLSSSMIAALSGRWIEVHLLEAFSRTAAIFISQKLKLPQAQRLNAINIKPSLLREL